MNYDIVQNGAYKKGDPFTVTYSHDVPENAESANYELSLTLVDTNGIVLNCWQFEFNI